MTNKGRLLIVDDEKLIRWSLDEEFKAQGYEVASAETGTEALSMIEAREYDIVLLDIRLPDTSGIEVLRKVKRAGPSPAVIMITANADIETAVEAMREGAYDYVAKPYSMDEMKTRVERALEALHLKEEVSYLRRFRRDQLRPDQVVGRSKIMKSILDLAGKVAKSEATVLILGESGTGKDLLARHIHFHSPRAELPFLEINCAALPETLLESELMGHEKGAFTDAKTAKRGLFEQAGQGTIFLDEIGDMPLAIQAKVLKLIETKRFRRLGGERDIEADVRIIAATNRNLKKLICEGKMREDLYYRLSVILMALPPLRERRGDIPLLASHFLKLFNRGASRIGFSADAIELLTRYDWPGNVRELRNVLERALILNDGAEITPRHLPPEIAEQKVPPSSPEAPPYLPLDGLSLVDAEREMIKRALREAQGNQSKAARLLNISRDTLRYRVKSLEIDVI